MAEVFRDALHPFHQYRQRALLDATIALSQGGTLTLTSIGRFLPGQAQVKNKIKCVDRLLENTILHRDVPAIFNNLTSLLIRPLFWCVIAVTGAVNLLWPFMFYAPVWCMTDVQYS